jgi:hypothetical protein
VSLARLETRLVLEELVAAVHEERPASEIRRIDQYSDAHGPSAVPIALTETDPRIHAELDGCGRRSLR